jgi:hypothetical protein
VRRDRQLARRVAQTGGGFSRTLDRWRACPSDYAKEFLFTDLWEGDGRESDQKKVVNSWPKNRKVAVRSGHKTGKSKSGAVLAWWAAPLHDGARVILTAPTWRQVEQVIWREVVAIYRNCKDRGHDIGGRLYESPDKGWVGPGGRQIIGISTDDPDRFSGISGRVYYIADEGAGIDDGIQEAIEGNMAGGAWFMTFGNPTRTEGWFFDAFHDASADYLTHHISSERTPNARGLPGYPGLATKDWIEGRRAAWGEDSAKYQVRARGNFPEQASSSVFSLAVYTEAQQRWTPTPPLSAMTRPLEAGLDCARFGDDRNALVMRRGGYVYEPKRWGGMDSIQVAGTARKMLHDMLTPLERARGVIPRVRVDVIGIGAGVFDQLNSFPDIDAIPVNVAMSPTIGDAGDDDENGHDVERYENLRAQVWFVAAEHAKRAMLPPDRELRADCLAPQYRFTKLAKTIVESKDDIKKRLKRSPDAGDALCLAFYEPPIWRPEAFNIPGL